MTNTLDNLEAYVERCFYTTPKHYWTRHMVFDFAEQLKKSDKSLYEDVRDSIETSDLLDKRIELASFPIKISEANVDTLLMIGFRQEIEDILVAIDFNKEREADQANEQCDIAAFKLDRELNE